MGKIILYMSLQAKNLSKSVHDGLQNALSQGYLKKGDVQAPMPSTVPDGETGVEKLVETDVDNIVTAEIAKKWHQDFAAETFLTVTAGGKLESLIKSVAGLERDVSEILAKYKEKNP